MSKCESLEAVLKQVSCEARLRRLVRKQTCLSKQGNSRLRKALYFPAVTALTWNPLIKAHYDRLREKGKPRMVALGAAMRKLLMIAYGVLKHQKPFDPAWQLQSPTTPS